MLTPRRIAAGIGVVLAGIGVSSSLRACGLRGTAAISTAVVFCVWLLGSAPDADVSCLPPRLTVDRATVAPGEILVIRGEAFGTACNDTGQPGPVLGIPQTVITVRMVQGDLSVPLVMADADDDYRFIVEVAVPSSFTKGPASVTASTVRGPSTVPIAITETGVPSQASVPPTVLVGRDSTAPRVESSDGGRSVTWIVAGVLVVLVVTALAASISIRRRRPRAAGSRNQRRTRDTSARSIGRGRVMAVGCEFSGVGVPGVDQQTALARHRAIVAQWRARGLDHQLSRDCVIAIAETYVQNLLVDEREMDALLNEDVLRWTEQNKADPPRDTTAESIRESTRAGAERAVVDIVNRRWIVEGNQALVIADIVVAGLAGPVTLYERFLIRWGQIAEIEAISQRPRG